MGSYIPLREGDGLVQRAWSNVRALLLRPSWAPEHTQGLGMPLSCPGHRQQQARQDASSREAGLESGLP